MLGFRDVFELEVADFADAPAGFPEDGDEGLVARVVADVEELFDVLRGEEVAAFKFAFFFPGAVRFEPGDLRHWFGKVGEALGVVHPGHELLENDLFRGEGFPRVWGLALEEAGDIMLYVLAGELVEVFAELVGFEQEFAHDLHEADFLASLVQDASVAIPEDQLPVSIADGRFAHTLFHCYVLPVKAVNVQPSIHPCHALPPHTYKRQLSETYRALYKSQQAPGGKCCFW